MPDDMWVRCTRPDCGDYIHIYDIDEHLNMHAAVAFAENDAEMASLPHRRRRRSPGQRGSRNSSSMSSGEQSPRKLEKSKSKSGDSARPRSGLLHYFSGNAYSPSRSHGRSSSRKTYRYIGEDPRRAPGRLGKRELGPYAFEDSMPDEVRRDLIEGSAPRHINRFDRNGRMYRETFFPNETPGIIPVLADLAASDRNTAASYFCHPSTRHIHRVQCKGNFCGYWSMQVLLSYLQAVNPDGPQEIPNVLKLQSYIHQAWDRGICPHGKVETGGVLNTRKWIGTHEALAFFTRIGVKVDALGFGGKDRESSAAMDLFDHIEAYFMSGSDAADTRGTSYITKLPPIYFQRFGHSMTIVGLERLVDGSRNLFIFDSSFATSKPMQKRLDGQRHSQSSPENLLRAYRKSELYLSQYDEFEIIV